MMAPSGQRFLKDHPAAAILCLDCFKANPPKGGEAQLAAPAKDIIREVVDAEPNPWLRRN